MRKRSILLGLLGAAALAGGGWFLSLDKETQGLLAAIPTDRDVLMWSQDQRKAAFRAGHLTIPAWDEVNIGLYSAGVGLNVVAAGTTADTLCGDGRLVLAADGPPRAGDYPTSIWSPGEVIDDPHVIRLPAGLPPGTYHVLIGLYRLETGERLPVNGSDQIKLETITIREPSQ